MEFIPIDIHKHKEVIIPFRRDSFIVSFGTDEGLGDENTDLDWIHQRSTIYPNGFVLVVENGVPIGQLELNVKEYEGNLYYLVPEKRGVGLGSLLHAYAIQFFKDHDVKEYHLRATNEQAIAFYKKNGMQKLKEEMDEKVIRMVGKI